MQRICAWWENLTYYSLNWHANDDSFAKISISLTSSGMENFRESLEFLTNFLRHLEI